MSQFGFQNQYDSQAQQELGIDDDNVNPTAVQGWNGVAIHRKDLAQSVDILTVEVVSLQFEEDVQTRTPDLDLLNFQSQDETFNGIWTLATFEKTTTVDDSILEFIVNRYMPKWVYGRIEDWDDDYRWSPESPQIQVKLYSRIIADDFAGESQIIWTDLPAFAVLGSRNLQPIFGSLISFIILSNSFF